MLSKDGTQGMESAWIWIMSKVRTGVTFWGFQFSHQSVARHLRFEHSKCRICFSRTKRSYILYCVFLYYGQRGITCTWCWLRTFCLSGEPRIPSTSTLYFFLSRRIGMLALGSEKSRRIPCWRPLSMGSSLNGRFLETRDVGHLSDARVGGTARWYLRRRQIWRGHCPTSPCGHWLTKKNDHSDPESNHNHIPFSFAMPVRNNCPTGRDRTTCENPIQPAVCNQTHKEERQLKEFKLNGSALSESVKTFGNSEVVIRGQICRLTLFLV